MFLKFIAGPEAFSEPETKAISQAIKKIQSETNLYAYYTLHSYGRVRALILLKLFSNYKNLI